MRGILRKAAPVALIAGPALAQEQAAEALGAAVGGVIGLVIVIVVGAVIGWLASMVVKGGGSGIVTNVLYGIGGSLLAGYLPPLLGIPLGAVGGIIAAIVGVETFYGTRTGSYRAVDALATLAFDYPPRSKFFRGELRQLFLLARDEQLDVTQLTGSYAGALGPPQFIPSSYRNFSVDGDNDGRRNLLSDWNDIFASVANYFVVHNWQRAQPVAVPARLKPDNTRGDTENELVLRDTVESLSRQGVDFSTDLPAKAPAMLISLAGEEGTEYWVGFQNFYAITRYNRSPMYALAVFQLSEAIAAGVRKSDAAP